MSEFIISDYSILFGTSSFINAVAALLIGMYVLLKNYRNKAYCIFAIMNLAVGVWSTAYGFWQFSNNASSAIFWIRILIFGSTFIPVLYLHFIINLIKKYRKYAYVIKLAYAVTFFLALFSFTPYYFSGVEEKLFFPYWPNGSLLYLFNILFIYIGIFCFAFVIQYKHYNKLDLLLQKQVRWVMIGSILAVIGGLSNFPLWFDIPILPYGNLFVFAYVLFFTYSITRYALLDIKIVLRKSLIYTLSLGVSIGFISWVLLRYQTVFQDDIETLGPWFTIIVVVAFAIIYPILQWAIKKFVDRLIFSDTLNLFEKFNKKQYLLYQSPELRGFSEKTVQSAMAFFHSSCEFLVWNEEEKNYKQYYESSRLIVLLSNDPILQILERFKRHIYTEDIEKFASQEGLEREVIKSCVKRLKQLDVTILMPLVIHDRILAIVLVGRSEHESTDREISQLAMQFSQKLSYTLMVNYQFKPLQQ